MIALRCIIVYFSCFRDKIPIGVIIRVSSGIPVYRSYLVYRYTVHIWYTGIPFMSGIPVYRSYLEYRYTAHVWYTGILFMSGIPVYHSCLVYRLNLVNRYTV